MKKMEKEVETWNVNLAPPCMKELEEVLSKMKEGRSSNGCCPMELYKNSKFCRELLLELIIKVYQGATPPQSWLE